MPCWTLFFDDLSKYECKFCQATKTYFCLRKKILTSYNNFSSIAFIFIQIDSNEEYNLVLIFLKKKIYTLRFLLILLAISVFSLPYSKINHIPSFQNPNVSNRRRYCHIAIVLNPFSFYLS